MGPLLSRCVVCVTGALTVRGLGDYAYTTVPGAITPSLGTITTPLRMK